MPELPDVEMFKRIAAKCAQRTVQRAAVDDPALLKGISASSLQRRVKGARIESASRHGKHLFLNLDSGGSLEMHFGTNGSLRRLGGAEADPPCVRFSLVLDKGDRLAYLNPRRIGDVQLVPDADTFIAEARLGPDALDRRFDLEALEQRLAGRKRDIKSILMDQQALAGIGNIYSDEILFQARIHPDVPGDALSKKQTERLFKSIKHVLETAIACEAGSEEGVERLPRGFLLRERHPGGHCPRCGTELTTAKRAGRTSYYCARCQSRS